MITQPLLEYIERQFGRNIPREDILKKIVDAGWNIKDAEEGVSTIEKKLGKIVSSVSVSSSSAQEEAPKKKSIIPVVLLIIGIVFILGAIGALAYWKYALDMKPLFGSTANAAQPEAQTTTTVDAPVIPAEELVPEIVPEVIVEEEALATPTPAMEAAPSSQESVVSTTSTTTVDMQ